MLHPASHAGRWNTLEESCCRTCRRLPAKYRRRPQTVTFTYPTPFDRVRPASDPGAAASAEAEPMGRSAASQLATVTRRSLQPPSCPPSERRRAAPIAEDHCCAVWIRSPVSLVVGVEGQPWVPVGSTVGPLLLGRHPWVPAQKSSTVGPPDQFSLLRALGNQTKLSTFDTVAFRVRRRPDRFHAHRHSPPLHSPCQKLETLTIF
jgi:hypothetical protein